MPAPQMQQMQNQMMQMTSGPPQMSQQMQQMQVFSNLLNLHCFFFMQPGYYALHDAEPVLQFQW